MEDEAKRFQQALLDLDRIEAKKILTENARGSTPAQLIIEIVVPTLKSIGDSWQDGSLALSQIYMSGRICEELVDELLPPATEKRLDQPKMGVAVLNDYHLLGKRIVYSQIRSAGYEITDYGRKTVEELMAVIENDELEVILISTLMYPSALDVKEVREQLDTLGLSTKIIVGGAPFNLDDSLWQNVGAHAMAHDGPEALERMNQLMGRK